MSAPQTAAAPAAGKKSRKRRRRLKNVIGIDPQRFDRSQLKFYAYLIPIGVITGLPILLIFLNAFKPMDELFAYPPRFFITNPTLDNFRQLFAVSANTTVPASRYLFNSILSTFLVVVLTLVITISAAYCLSKKRFKMKKLIFTANTLALMFVSVAVSIPRYFIMVNTGMIDNYLAHIVPLLAMPVGLFLVKQFMDQIPDSLIEAAQIDGASDFLIVRKIITPMVAPALSTVTILAFQSSWNGVEASQMYINNESLKNFAFYMSTLASGTGNAVAGQGISAAATLIMFLPNLILFIILQSRVMNSMAHSGIK